jgi:hypothetical protein
MWNSDLLSSDYEYLQGHCFQCKILIFLYGYWLVFFMVYSTMLSVSRILSKEHERILNEMGLSKTIKNLGQNSQSPGQDSWTALLEYKSPIKWKWVSRWRGIQFKFGGILYYIRGFTKPCEVSEVSEGMFNPTEEIQSSLFHCSWCDWEMAIFSPW